MIYVFCILIGIGIGQAFRAGLTIQLKRALKFSEDLRRAAGDTNLMLGAELLRHQRTIANIKRLAWRAHMERIQSLGGAALLPAPADRGTRPILAGKNAKSIIRGAA